MSDTVQSTSKSTADHPVIAFDGAITSTTLVQPGLAFAAEVIFYLQHPQLRKLASQKPPLHFHCYQEEYIEVTEGKLAVEADGKEQVLTPEDGVFQIKPWTHHRLYPPPDDGSEITKFILSGAETEEQYQLDHLFFSNWYAYQDTVFVQGGKFSLVQILSMFDAGGSYLSFPKWVPGGRTLSRLMGIVVGRWIGGLMGYQPYYKEWSTDWELACRRMEGSYFQRRFIDRLRSG
ncbi:hypothetical protein BT63DRAFT_422918 [Microthyrium microscopicum]|uniref:Cupin 2 conserved barrel domain-containing protein n=1 Tax=Microthyrium microscopicum TaxID=703497 RepID=A0A6A6UJP2_9PEZI|nr:hypothetical protein BT63DRAFT_422918 [Microthyrium microscopicum]